MSCLIRKRINDISRAVGVKSYRLFNRLSMWKIVANLKKL
nr:MAG TPA: hypothetical protein [Bacteriophage sp.]